MIRDTVIEYKAIRSNLQSLIHGIVLSIDPSCGSKGENGSLPGWAVSYKGELVAAGVMELPVEEDLWVRLQALHHGMRKLMREYNPDILVYENIAPKRYGGGSAHSHASLLKAVGVVLSVSGPTAVIGLRPTIWTKWKRSNYIKSDQADAVEMLWIAIESAREIEIDNPPRGYGKATGKAGTGVIKAKKPTKAAEIREGDITSGTTKQPKRGRRKTRTSRKATVPPF